LFWGAADDLAHGAFGNPGDEFLLLGDVEQEVARVLDLPEDREADVDHVLVTGEHQSLALAAASEIDLVFGLDRKLLDALHRPEDEMQPRTDGTIVAAETQHKAVLVGLDGVGTHIQPAQRHQGKHGKPLGAAKAAAGAAAAGQDLAEPFLALAYQLFEVRRLIAAASRRSGGALPPGSLAPWPAPALPATTSPLIAPWHPMLFLTLQRLGRGAKPIAKRARDIGKTRRQVHGLPRRRRAQPPAAASTGGSQSGSGGAAGWPMAVKARCARSIPVR